MKKKIIIETLIIILLVTIILIVAACSSDSNNEESSETTTTQNNNLHNDHEHLWSEWITETEATCTNKGLKSRSCPCGAKDEISFAELQHTFGEWSITKEAKCSEEGTKERSCSNCDFKEEESLSALPHTEGTSKIVNDEKHFLCIFCNTLLRVEKLQTSEGLKIENGIVLSLGNCSSKDIVIPSTHNNITVSTIGEQAFEYENITSIVLSQNTTVIKEKAFYQCSNLNSVYFGNNITTIEKRSFSRCISLKTLYLPGSLTTLGEAAFEYCSALETIYMENSINKFELKVFQYCKNLSDIYFNGTMEEWNAIEKDREWDLGIETYTVHCTDGNIEK